MMWYWGSGMHWWGWMLGGFAMVLFWAAVIFAFFWAIGNLGTAGRPREDDPKAILDRRLARGEIDAEEYHRILDTILEPGAFKSRT